MAERALKQDKINMFRQRRIQLELSRAVHNQKTKDLHAAYLAKEYS